MDTISGARLASGSITAYQPLVILLFVFTVFLTACGGGASDGGSSPVASSASTTTGGSGGSSGDTTRPTVTINSPTSSSTYTAPGSTIGLAGSASDNVGVTQVTWSNSLGGSGTASGTGSWSVGSITLQNGTNTITVTARDAAGNTGSGTLIVSYNSSSSARTTYYLSPTGSDTANDGRLLSSPWKSFAKAFGSMAAGDELILLDGTYSAAAATGYINYQGTGSAQPPSGTSLGNVTYVHALNPGNVTVQGGLFIGRSTRKDSFIKIQGITFEGGGDLYNTSYVTVKDCGFHGSFGIGTNDHDNGNDYNLIEDVWVWASGERIIAINYRSHHNVWRRVVVRGDGCGTLACSDSGNPNVGITVYNSMDVSVQNVIVVDRILAATDEPYGDFAVAQHAPGPDFGRAEWLGTISLNSPDTGYYMEPDASVDPTIKISNAIAWNASGAGFNVARTGTNNLLENLTAYGNGDGVRVAPELTSGILRNVISVNAGRYGINSRYTPSYVDVYNAGSSTYNQTTCSAGCYTSNPQADGVTPSLKYITRIESGSLLNGKGAGGADIGANVLYRYGIDGSRFSEANYNTLTSAALWPWPNEDRIKREMCANTARGFCSTSQRLGNLGPVTLTTYIWEYLGSPIPSGVYP